jgi:ATP-dependent helicase/nuclease subunit A
MTVTEAAEAEDVPAFDDIEVEVVALPAEAGSHPLLYAASGLSRKTAPEDSLFSQKTDDHTIGGVRFGTLVHAMLADVPLVAAGTETIDRLARAHGRLLGAAPAEVTRAAALVAQVLAAPIIQRAAAAEARNACFRETPVTLRLDTGVIVEGIVDLAYDDGDGFVVVDFKTDRELEGSRERYERQVRIYAAAIRAATGRPVRAALMRV